MSFVYPKWWSDETVTEKERAKFIMEYCARYASPAGTYPVLSVALGYGPHWAATTLMKSTRLSPESAVAIEKLLGRDVITREAIRPDLFLIEV